ncbi:MAG: 50S ribosomal protein L18 [Bacteroidales bacterium]|nr:50S ribosomal protein L18 [Bacteroidales bacterium]NLD63491.1 50S ribosomal protein L18 [Bacteroidales bacterium]
MALSKTEKREKIKLRIRNRIRGTAEKPRVSVFRSNKQIYAQAVDDVNGVTLASVSSREKEIATITGKKKSEVAMLVGKRLAEVCREKGIETVVFDRSGYQYHGRVKSLADGAREGGLKF